MKNIFLMLLFSNVTFSQCVSGDCKNGFGKYDFGFATYEGIFKNGKPNGQGTMDYGGGDKFVGNFTNGQEDGDGKLYKKNIPLDVTYVNGKVKIREKQVTIGGNAPTVAGCQKGDCYNGFGTIKFDSGNRYEGNFENGIKSGEGTFYYASGNTYSGNFVNNNFSKGTFSYANEKMSFEGIYDVDGAPKTGKYYYPTNKATVFIENRKITKIDNPVARKADSLAVEQSKPKKCSVCKGAGICAGVTSLVNKQSYYSINYVNSSGNTVGTSSGNVMNTMVRETSWPTECKECRGTGKVYDKGSMIKIK
jgi:hypothetical protein